MSKKHTKSVRLDAAELFILDQHLKKSGMNFSEFIRCIIKSEDFKIKQINKNREQEKAKAEADIILKLSKIGNNLNQIARAINKAVKDKKDVLVHLKKLEKLDKNIKQMAQ